ncbi:succinyl-diaminopimelate desuccinylase [Chenggangzhangella methanolivorans]|uniref:Succinyl-diaminopimelate desuccinylase n=1 Tax=Chenggangzhangella methanolivorans TaxID=1437009 RepID=A0A9E6URK2_9HYPH|nr:succinyl-diaminopimelate desuccinylase [Chenggangzhangella methanolivorans]QZO02375.1 succinyl-diaminopimelate desuccinylase [Chenggangzhangella methanolivorans]
MDPRDPVAVAQGLIACESVTPAEGGALALLEGLLTPLGFEVRRPVFTDQNTPDVENLFARRGEGASFVFAGHTDVVPVGEAAAWTQGPFSGAVRNGELFGRGAVDMKGAIACMVAAVARRPEAGPVAFLITGDEEGPAVNGTAKLLDWAQARGETFSACLLGEPSNPQALGDEIKVGRRGSHSGTLTIRGVQGHVAYPHRADNPIRKLQRALAALMDEPLDQGSEHFQPSNLEVVGVESGAGAFNVIPGVATARFNVRYNDGHTWRSLEDTIRSRLNDAIGGDAYDLVFETNTGDAFLTPPGDFVEAIADAVEAETGRRPALTTSGGTSDARFIRAYCPVLEFGLVGQTMHKVDERVAVADLETLTRIYERALVAAAGERP